MRGFGQEKSTRIGILAIAIPTAVAAVLFVVTNDDQVKIPNAITTDAPTLHPKPKSSEASVTPSKSDLIVGAAIVIDGDTIDVKGVRIRLHGIDAPESGQKCEKDGQLYRCGKNATQFLDNLLRGNTISCSPRDRDRYGRIVATCSVKDADVGTTMVANGWALAYRRYERAYIPYEEQAQQDKRGIWAGRYIVPQRWRAGDRL
ncbi:thermonuclease family protein [Falsihalocynthiibacter sp. CO-5D18]|uniref:thermonuclease family protein n=1 Tax=Falsihalocynthiibacter sp. CO-5D18 TaxID=3240872 RepID=UPI00350F9216